MAVISRDLIGAPVTLEGYNLQVVITTTQDGPNLPVKKIANLEVTLPRTEDAERRLEWLATQCSTPEEADKLRQTRIHAHNLGYDKATDDEVCAAYADFLYAKDGRKRFQPPLPSIFASLREGHKGVWEMLFEYIHSDDGIWDVTREARRTLETHAMQAFAIIDGKQIPGRPPGRY